MYKCCGICLQGNRHIKKRVVRQCTYLVRWCGKSTIINIFIVSMILVNVVCSFVVVVEYAYRGTATLNKR